jgi:hypothetical protein
MARNQSGGLAKASCIHGQDLRSALEFCRPAFDLPGFGGILSASQFDTSLNLTEGDGREKALSKFEALEPGHDTSVRLRLPHFRDHVGIDEIANQSNTGGLRDLWMPRLGSGKSKRGPSPRRTSFQVRPLRSFNRRYSSKETTTAVSMPRLVTT